MSGEAGHVAVFCEHPGFLTRAMEVFRKIEPERPVVCLFEDIDAIIEGRHGAIDPERLRVRGWVKPETALCLLAASDVAGGIWTPVSALQGRLRAQLEQHTSLRLSTSR